jgi:hypothetical protein
MKCINNLLDKIYMKHFKLLLKLLLFLNVLSAQAQNNTKAQAPDGNNSTIFKINPMGQDNLPRKLKFGKTFKFEISNVNTITLNGYTTSTPVTFETVAPSIFSDIKIPDIPKTPELFGVLSEAVKGSSLYDAFLKSGHQKKKSVKAASKEEEEIKSLKQELALRNAQLTVTFQKSYNDFVANYHQLQRYTVAEDTLYKMLPDVIIRDTEVLKSNTKSYMAGLYKLSADMKPEDLNKALIDNLNQTLISFNENYIALKGAYEALNGTTVSDVSAIAGSLKNTTGSITIGVDKATATIKSDPKFLVEYTSATKVFNSLNLDDSQSQLFNKAFKGIALYNTIQKEKFIIYTDPEQLNDDEKDIPPVLKNSKGIVVKQFNPITIKAYGGLKVNFTTGYLLTFRGDDNYSYYNTGNPATIAGVVKQKSSALTNSIGALAHVYSRTTNGVAAGLSGGFSLTNNGNIGFYLGGSGLFLEKNRLALTAGISYVKVNVLNKGNLNVVNDQPDRYTFNSTETKINYDPLYKPGFFIGITYNVFTDSSTKPAVAK